MRQFVFFFFLLVKNVVFTISVSNPSSPAILQEGVLLSDEKWCNFRIGYEQKFIRDRKLKFAKKMRKQSFYMEKISGKRHLANFVLNIMERFDVFFKFGEAYYFSLFNHNHNQYDFQTSYGGYYSGGGQFVLWEIKDASFGVEGGYGFFRSSTKFFYENKHPIEEIDFGFFANEWYVNIGLSYKMGYFIPFLGVSVCDMKAKIKRTLFFDKKQLRLHSLKKTGFFLGSSFSRCSFFFINAAIHFYNESSQMISCEMRF